MTSPIWLVSVSTWAAVEITVTFSALLPTFRSASTWRLSEFREPRLLEGDFVRANLDCGETVEPDRIGGGGLRDAGLHIAKEHGRIRNDGALRVERGAGDGSGGLGAKRSGCSQKEEEQSERQPSGGDGRERRSGGALQLSAPAQRDGKTMFAQLRRPTQMDLHSVSFPWGPRMPGFVFWSS
jgi:hypothetical protein